MFKKLFKKKKSETIDLDLNLSEQGKESIKKFSSRTDNERMGDIMMFGDKGDNNFFYLIYFAALHDSDINVRFAALKRIPNFKDNQNFDLLITNLSKPNVGEKLEPYYSMMLCNLGKITPEELNDRVSKL